MLIAMGIAAAFCIGIGVFPELLYAMLPNATRRVRALHGAHTSSRSCSS